MTKEEYINEKTKEIKEKKKQLEKSFNLKETLSYSAIALFGGLTLASIIPKTPLALATLGLTSLAICYKVKCDKKNKIEKEKLNQEIKHLDNLREKDNITNEETYDKVCNKVCAISSSQIDAEGKYDDANTLTNLTYAITAIGSVLTFINPSAFWIPLVGIASNILTGENELKKYNKKINLENRIDNLIHDLDVINPREIYDESISNIQKQKTHFDVKEEEYYKIYEKNNGFDYQYPIDKPKQFIKK